ncbi:hypothetical protein POJ06DRAFT_215834 [Lipomyces tetrasporus]|uniref:Actin-like ATPase domain-containing protein n=1 Tax=Lipomyces tetrasporus TaxID=54092 RepID=A0AAD7VPH2_9ASCO|nr:uncharacterized protein POJ06DRAFT_215834 [Lipomyces tetrasporus]KAJ8097148.1 hypothetical protein POJ06DRAFT_215834 [Lipomyces tetrasporus]
MPFFSKLKKQKDPAATHRPVPPPNLQPRRSTLLSTNSVPSINSASSTGITPNNGYLNNYNHSKQPEAHFPGRPQPVEVPGNSVVKPSLIVGIDFGTTNSGVAYSWVTGADAKEVVLSEWAGLGNMSLFKIPTVLYYDSSGGIVGWGANTEKALSPAGFPIPGTIKIEYFKLLLQRNYNRYNDLIRNLPLPPGKTAIDVAADYLSLMRMTMRSELQKALGDIFLKEEQNIKYFLTVPAIWDEAGKAATRQAAVQAGFVDNAFDPRLSLITEPEAAAIYCAKRGVLELKTNDSFLIVDCGGGTVDLIAYEVEDENPFTVHECTSGTGGACGSTTIDANFMKLVRARVQVMNELGLLTAAKEEKIMRRCREDFSKRIKPSFKNDRGPEIAVEIGLDINCPQAQIVEGYMIFQPSHILAAFEPSVKAVVALVREQIAAVEAQHKRLQAILVVGGYGASTYLFETLKNQVPPAYSRRILRPMDSVSAIVRGAVVTGIYERVLTSRVCRKHYLMMTLQQFQPGVHPEAYRIKAPDGGYRCKNTRKIFLEKGQRLKIGEQAKVEFFRQVLADAPRIFEDTLYTCDEDRCPDYITDPAIKVFAILTTDLSHLPVTEFESCTGPNGEQFYRIHFDVALTLDGGNEMRAEWLFKGKVMGHVRTRFS